MSASNMSIPQRDRIEQFLTEHGADRIPHPGGTLLAHLKRVAGLLADWDAADHIQLAGLCHATYGTDGFGQSLLDIADRPMLVNLIGEPAEALVYFYASCDRGAVYSRLADDKVLFRDRFTGTEEYAEPRDLSAFMEITAANELDVMTQNSELAARHGVALHELFGRTRHHLSPKAWHDCHAQLPPVTP
ncbi:hypothetical protein OHB26_34595 [Nocardia sp. NBC_01503]|uniref:DUF6817 domain-containing protein n=1 Tax=Nocardia sp. NBC_01503 TaxID=2975997 RepID=UPI002E7C1D63|nr:hypothetical protein [Nocardia sp. NBC_01503]WTL31974.1 hypothetical protein OHB26_34595 [Nocardia sp. NBC_01503]